MATPRRPTIRLDKWLWHARFFRTRSLATRVVTGGHVRVNGLRTTRAAHAVGVGDTLTFVQGRRLRIVRLVALSTRRGPASEAQALYLDLSPPPEPPAQSGPAREPRPASRDRRRIAQMKRRPGSDGHP